jgi:hypothetical protein
MLGEADPEQDDENRSSHTDETRSPIESTSSEEISDYQPDKIGSVANGGCAVSRSTQLPLHQLLMESRYRNESNAAWKPADRSDLQAEGGSPLDAIRCVTLSPNVTTVLLYDMPMNMNEDAVSYKLLSWGLSGQYDFFFMWENSCKAVINFTSPSFAQLCQQRVLMSGFPGKIEASAVQGLAANVALRNQMLWAEQLLQKELPTLAYKHGQMSGHCSEAAPAEEAAPIALVPTAQKDVRFRKTRMCMFHAENRCAMGQACLFAHNPNELTVQPNLYKTRICFNYNRGRCMKNPCNYAHGTEELRSEVALAASDGIAPPSWCQSYSDGLDLEEDDIIGSALRRVL